MAYFVEVHSVYEIRMTQFHGGKRVHGVPAWYAKLKVGGTVRKLRISRAQFLAWGGQGCPDARQLPLPDP